MIQTMDREIVRPSLDNVIRCAPMGVGLGLGLSIIRDGLTVFDPSSLALSGWYRASYGGAPWSGLASAGASGAKTLQTNGADPSVGTALNGFTPATFNGTTQNLKDAVAHINDYISVSAYRVVILANINSPPAPAPQPYLDPGILGDGGGGYWGITVNSSSFSMFHYDSSYEVITRPIASGWHMIDASFDGSNLHLSIDAGTPATPVAVANLNAGTSGEDVRVGSNYLPNVFFSGSIAEIITADTVLLNATSVDFKNYFNTRYALSL